MQRKTQLRFVVVAAAIALTALGAMAEETKGRWRFELAVGGYSSVDSIPSDAANVQSGNEWGDKPTNVFDPRPDQYGTYEASNTSGPRIDVRASYGIASYENVEFVLSGGIGYFESKIENLEFSYSLDRLDPDYVIPVIPAPEEPPRPTWVPGCESLPISVQEPDVNCRFFYGDPGGDPFNSTAYETWKTQLIDPATLRVFPVTLDVLARFRPTKRFNPYLGVGIGYYIVQQESTEQWRAIQNELDASYVSYIERVEGSLSTRYLKGEGKDGASTDMKRPEIESPDTLFAELRGGAEWQWRPKTAFFFEVLFSWAKDNIEITADGKQQWGRGVPTLQFRDPLDADASPYGGRAAYITKGGIKKKLVNQDGVFLGDGPWPGEYYLNGGTLDYGGWSFSAGVRFTM